MKKPELPCIVIDTNVLISAGLLPLSRAAEAVAAAVGRFVIAQNADTWRELETRIVREKFDRYFGSEGRARHLIAIARSVRQVPPVARDAASRDASDDKFIALAVDAGAGFIISGDADLLSIGTYKGIEILSPARFLERLQSGGSDAAASLDLADGNTGD